MAKTDAERSREYRRINKEKKEKNEKKIKKPAKSSADRVRELRARRKILMQQTHKQNENDSSIVNDNVPGLPDSKIKMINEIADVKVQTTETETVVKINMEISNENVKNKKRKVSELDKFKRRLIRAIARLLYKENKPEEEIWNELKTETGCDCELLWSRMRALTIKKLVRLFTAEDKIENITKIAQLSVTDWLLYDLVLVHEKVDVIGQELGYKEEPEFLRDLFDLVEEFNIEQAVGEELSKMWFDATAIYNNTGKRQCSPMLLQKRWYQLKESSRNNFYNFWFQYRGDSRKLEKANEFKPSDLQLDIVKRYKEIVMKPFVNWEELIKEKRVALPEDFERLRLAQNKITISENEPDLQVTETEFETIDLEEINDLNDDNREGNDFNIDIVKNESLADHDDDVIVLESVHIPLEESGSSDINSDTRAKTKRSPINRDYNESETIESESEQIMPRICSVTSTVCLESVEDKDATEDLPSNEIDTDSEARGKSVESGNIILKQVVKNVIENKISTNFDENSDTSKKEVLKFDTAIEELRSNSIIDLDKAASINSSVDTYLNNDMGFDDFSQNINFIDDGIEYTDEDCIEEYNLRSEKKSETVEVANEEKSTIDLKLLLTSVVYTKKLDDMDVFRFINYNSVKDNRVLQNAERESKPEDSKSINMKRKLQECNDDDSRQVGSESGFVSPDGDVPASSWLFRKPKVNSYNPMQLCKNPDFNKRLKRLSAAFYTSERNRLQLNQCKPLTVDLHKTFEAKLIDNTLYLKKNINSDIRITLNETISTSYQTEPPEILAPSIDNENADDQKISIEQTSQIRTERNSIRVINLPDIVQIRRVNQELLVAEVSPIQVSNPVHEVNTKAMNDLNTENKPLISNMSPLAIDKEVFEPLANVSQFSLETDKVHSDNDSSQLAKTINIDIEQSETLSSKCNVIDGAKNSKEQYNKCSQPLPKNKIRTHRKHSYMQLSWLPKPQSTKTEAIDCLLAADTVERILILCKTDYVPPDPKVLKPKRKKKTVISDINLTENQVAVSKKTAIKEKKNATQTQKPRKKKCRINITSQTTNIKIVCCWSRQKIENYHKLNTGRHYCPKNQCVCCCKGDLETKILAIEEQRKRCEPIILSDDESLTIVAAKKHHPVSKVTVGTNIDYDKDFEEQFADSLNLLKDNANQVTPTISLTLGNLPQTFSNESGCQTLTPNRIEKPPSSGVQGNKITKVAGTPQNLPKIPICLGKNKILLCSFKPTGGTVSVQNVKKYNQNSQSDDIPDGCHLVLLPNRELALSIDSGVELDANLLSHLPSLIATIQKQIHVMATSKSMLELNKITMNEEIVHLSDDENSSIKDNANNNLNINDSNTSESSSTQINIDSSDANIFTISGAITNITNEEKQIRNSDSNNLPSPKQSCNTPEPATTKNSTTTDVRDVIETSTHVITSKDNINGEDIDNSTNNAEDASGVNKKTILSDLMEMSGISADDINIGNNDVDLASSEENGSNIVIGATNNESVLMTQQVLSQMDSSTNLQREYVNIDKRIGIHPITNNIVVRAALLRWPELNIVSTHPELKFAYENGAQFFKMNVLNGIIVPIDICFKKDMEKVRMQARKRVSEVSKSVIDLTNDNDVATHSSNIRPTEPKIPTRETNESCVETSETIQPDKTKDPIKPIKLFKAINPSILRYSGRSLLVRPLKKSTVIENKIIGRNGTQTKQGLSVKNFDADNKLTNEIFSDAESDEEPLAKKAKRLKDNLEGDIRDTLIRNQI